MAAADFADSSQLRIACAYAALADIFVARAENSQPQDANWTKAQYYRQLSRQAESQLRLVVDLDGDGLAEHTRSLGSINLLRN